MKWNADIPVAALVNRFLVKPLQRLLRYGLEIVVDKSLAVSDAKEVARGIEKVRSAEASVAEAASVVAGTQQTAVRTQVLGEAETELAGKFGNTRLMPRTDLFAASAEAERKLKSTRTDYTREGFAPTERATLEQLPDTTGTGAGSANPYQKIVNRGAGDRSEKVSIGGKQ